MTHKSELEACRKLVEATGGKCNVTGQSQRVRGSKGIPDLYCQWHDSPRLRSVRLWFEVKVGDDTPSTDQAAFIMREIACGGLAAWGDSTVLESWLRDQWRLR